MTTYIFIQQSPGVTFAVFLFFKKQCIDIFFAAMI